MFYWDRNSDKWTGPLLWPRGMPPPDDPYNPLNSIGKVPKRLQISVGSLRDILDTFNSTAGGRGPRRQPLTPRTKGIRPTP